MTISLNGEMQGFVDDLVSSGSYTSANDAVTDGLKLLKDREELKKAKFERLRADVMHGYEQAKRGESRPVDFDELINRCKKKLRSMTDA